MNLPLIIILIAISIPSIVLIEKLKQKRNIKGSKLKYEIVTVNIDDSVIDTGNISDILEPVMWPCSDSKTKLSKEQKLMYEIYQYEAEINNGGHEQYFSNSSGNGWKELNEALELIKSTKAQQLFKQALNRFIEEPSIDRNIREEYMLENDMDFDEIDSTYYNDERISAELNEKIVSFIRSNREKFYYNDLVERPVL